MPAAIDLESDSAERRLCDHVAVTRPVQPHSAGCEECLDGGKGWIELWLCLSCGWVACSNDSPNQHAKGHYEETDHPVAIQLQHRPPASWCYVHQCSV